MLDFYMLLWYNQSIILKGGRVIMEKLFLFEKPFPKFELLEVVYFKKPAEFGIMFPCIIKNVSVPFRLKKVLSELKKDKFDDKISIIKNTIAFLDGCTNTLNTVNNQ